MQHRKSNCEQLQAKPLTKSATLQSEESPEQMTTARPLFTQEEGRKGDRDNLTEMEKDDVLPFKGEENFKKPLRLVDHSDNNPFQQDKTFESIPEDVQEL